MTYRTQSFRWAVPTLFVCLASVAGCSSDDGAADNAAGTSTGGVASAGSAGSVSGAGSGGAPTAGSASGGVSGSASLGGGGSGSGGAHGGTTSGGSGGATGGTTAGGQSGGAGGAGGTTTGGGGGGSGGTGGSSGGALALTTPAWTAMAGCAPDMKPLCAIFPKDNIGTGIGGMNKSPELDWTAGPSGTMSYAIVLHDLTNIMNGKPFVHWVIWNIPAATRMLPAGLDGMAMPAVPAGASQRSYAGSAYQGSGKCGNVYEFVLYALTTASITPTGTGQTVVADALEATGAPTATLRARSGAPGCTE